MKAIFISIFLLLFANNPVFSQEIHPNDKGQLIRIPVVFHFVHNNPEVIAYTRQKLEKVIELVNRGFNDVDVSKIKPPYDKIVAKCNIELYIPDVVYDKNGNIKEAISHHTTNKTFNSYANDMSSSYQVPYDKDLKSYGYVNSRKFLNIWVANLNGASYSTMPKEKIAENDGIVLNSYEFYRFGAMSSIDNLKYLAMVINHEIGHWLGLFHIWGKRLDTIVGNCNKDVLAKAISKLGKVEGYIYAMNYKRDNILGNFNDKIKDTPKQTGPNKFNFYGDHNSEMLMTCDGDKLSNYQNFMDYSYNVGMYTEGQKNKMRYNIFTYRHELIGAKKIVFNNQYSHKLEYKLTRFGRNSYEMVFSDNFIMIESGRYLLEIYDKTDRIAITTNIISIPTSKKGIYVFIDRNGCVKMKYIGEPEIYNITLIRSKCKNNTTFIKNDVFLEKGKMIGE